MPVSTRHADILTASAHAMASEQLVNITVDDARHVSGLLQVPDQARACFVLAHGAGAGMRHSFLAAVAAGLAARRIATLRYQFPYMERGSKRPDSPAVAHATVRAAVTAAAAALPRLPLIAGGKSFGGRMTSQAQAAMPLPDVRGLCFFGFPLHPAGKPATGRGAHLAEIHVPTLFLQGTKDALADVSLIKPTVASLGSRATLHLVADADHSFHVPARSGRKDAQVMEEILDVMAAWVGQTLRGD
jgi:predicted alpha/beta-hydrolase family hydrolase